MDRTDQLVLIGITVLMHTGDAFAVLSLLDAGPVDPLWSTTLAGDLAERLAGLGPAESG